MIRIPWLLLSLCLVACTTTQPGDPVDEKNIEVLDFPKIGEVVSGKLGNRLVAKEYKITRA